MITGFVSAYLEFPVTANILDVSACLLRARANGEIVHGWAIMKQTKRSGPTVYGVLDRLEDWGWVLGLWEDQGPESTGLRRRFYQLTQQGAREAWQLLAERRPDAIRELHGLSPGSFIPGFATGSIA